MKFEDENFEEEFMNWLNSKTEEEIISLLKKYAINVDKYSYKILKDDNLNEEYCFVEVNIEREQTQIEVKNDKKKKKDTIEIDENVGLGVAA